MGNGQKGSIDFSSIQVHVRYREWREEISHDYVVNGGMGSLLLLIVWNGVHGQ